MNTILEVIKPIKLLAGSHEDTGQTGQGCFMNVVAYLNGDLQITDQSPCVCVTIKPIVIKLNDLATDEQRQLLLPYVMRVMGTATTDKEVLNKRLKAVVKFAWGCDKVAERAATATTAWAATTIWAAETTSAACATAGAAAGAAATLRTAAAAAATAAAAAAAALRTAKTAAVESTLKAELVQLGLSLLEEVCPPAEPPKQEVLQRAQELCLLNGG